MNKRLILSVIVSFLASSSLFAQVEETVPPLRNTHFITGLGGSYVNIIDQGISPLLYKGIGGGVVLGHLHETSRSIAQSTARFDFNNPNNSINGTDMYTFRLEGLYQHFFQLKNQSGKKLKILPGISGLGRWVLRDKLSYTNNKQHVETRFSLAPALLIKRPFQLWKRDFEIGMFSQLPLVTYATRPLFASTRFPASVNQDEIKFFDYLKKGEVVSLGSYFRLSAQTYLLYSFKNGNALRLDYFWMFESYNALNPIRTGEHGLMISTFLKL
ncbi:hypothetical protein JKA74_11880 [Marivirga sp. S37H4]|uniref:Outer membrane protein beta-barrel domain-containing protein n=1 Tax=Marivirga aurantiaca TaxID=2802615 RepID=A0A935CC37_9BACT|nr:hypothetical protein [Marivirga aurantiaca]MBK6265738.1 hypothetical protein [Marivirga aurantiaca]